MGTEQLDIAVLSTGEAVALSGGTGSFRSYGEIPVGVLTGLPGDKLLIARRDFRPDHAWLIARALQDIEEGSRADEPIPIGWHRGADLWRNAKPMPQH